MIILQLGESLIHCPACWRGFIKWLETNNIPSGTDGFSNETFNEQLAPYNATFTENEDYDPPYIEFADEQDLVLFKLKFGI